MENAWWTGRPSIRYTRWMPHEALPRQHAFLWLDCLEALFGGAAGGGKSDCLLLASLQYVDIPGYAALLLRRTYPELAQPGGLMARSHEWLRDSDAHWDGNQRVWKFPSGATLNFGYLHHTLDKYRYAGSELQFVGFDELTDFLVEDYTFLFSRLRRPSQGPLGEVPLRMRAASNPGGRGHLWVKNRFMGKDSGENQRIFIPSRVVDNPYIDQASYVTALSELDEQTRLQLLEGDWDARPPGHWMLDHRHIEAAVELGRRWKEDYEAFIFHGEETFPEPAGGEIAVGIDWGESTQGYVIWPLERGGVYIPASEVVQHQGEPGAFTEKMVTKALYTGWPLGTMRYDAAGVQSARTFVRMVREHPEWDLQRMRSVSIPFSKYKYQTIGYMRWLMERSYKAIHKGGSQTAVMAIDPDNETLIGQLFQWQRKVSPTGEATDQAVKFDDHGPDAVIAGMAPIAARHLSRLETLKREASVR